MRHHFALKPLASAVGFLLWMGGSSGTAKALAPDALLAVDMNRATVIEKIVANWKSPLTEAESALLRSSLGTMRADELLAIRQLRITCHVRTRGYDMCWNSSILQALLYRFSRADGTPACEQRFQLILALDPSRDGVKGWSLRPAADDFGRKRVHPVGHIVIEHGKAVELHARMHAVLGEAEIEALELAAEARMRRVE